MRKISAMYEWSGGTDYRHTCYECDHCKKIKCGSRTVYKCLVYGNTDSVASDWKASYIACRHFNKPLPDRTVIQMQPRKKSPDEQIEGQMSIEDFLIGGIGKGN